MKHRLFTTRPSKRRTQTFGFRLSDSERAWLLDAAEGLELSPADVIRRALEHYALCRSGLKRDVNLPLQGPLPTLRDPHKGPQPGRSPKP